MLPTFSASMYIHVPLSHLILNQMRLDYLLSSIKEHFFFLSLFHRNMHSSCFQSTVSKQSPPLNPETALEAEATKKEMVMEILVMRWNLLDSSVLIPVKAKAKASNSNLAEFKLQMGPF